MKRLTALPAYARHANPDRLRERQAQLARRKKNTDAVYRQHCAAVAMKIRRELRA